MNRSPARWLLVVIGVLLWVLAIYPAYYVVHKPLTAERFWALADVALDLLTWLVLLAGATALGSRLTRRRLAYHSLLERLTFSAGLGLGIVSLLTFGLGLAGLLHRWLFWVLLLGGGLLLWREFRDLATALRRTKPARPRGAWPIFLWLFVAVTLALALILSLLPPTEWDSLVYHLVGPERYLRAQQLTFGLDNYYLAFPAFTEMLFTAAMALKGDVVARLIHFGYLLLVLGGLGAFAGRYWQRHGLVAVALFLSIPTAVQIATWSYVDLALTFYNLAALYALLNWLDQQADRPGGYGWLVLAGLLAGAAASIKYTGVVTWLVLAAVMLWALVRRRLALRQFLLGAGLLAALAMAVVAPWYVKNAVVYANPLYPLLWGGRGWNEISTRWLLVPGQAMSFLELLAVPWTMTVVGRQGTVAFDATYSPLFLTLLPLLLIVRRQGQYLGELLLAAAVGYAFWLASGAAAYGTFVLRGRQVLPIFAPLSLLCAYSLGGLYVWDRRALSLQRFMRVLVSLTLIIGLLGQVLLAIGLAPGPVLTGQQSRDQYLDVYTSQRLHQAIDYLNENLSAGDRVLFFWEPRSYGLEVPHQADVLFDNFAQRWAHYGSPEGVWAGLQQEGFGHLLVNRHVYPWIVEDFPITAEEQAAWEAFRELYLTDDRQIHAEGEFLEIYRLPGTRQP